MWTSEAADRDEADLSTWLESVDGPANTVLEFAADGKASNASVKITS